MRSLPLESVHLRARAELGDAGGAARVESYGEPGPLALAAREGAGLLDLSHRARLAVTGPERQSWLQGMVTNDVAKLQAGEGCAAAALTNKGKLVGDLRIHVRPSEIWIDAEAQRAGALLAHLSHFIIMEDCEVREISPELAVIGLVGRRATSIARHLFPTLGPLAAFAQVEPRSPLLGELPVVASGWPDLGLPGIAFWLNPAMGEQLWEAFRLAGAKPLGFDAAEILRVEAGRPREGAELDEDVIPLEAGLEGEISDSKGCYLGQEIIARISHRGHVNRKLAGFTLAGDLPKLPAPLSREGKDVGELRSAVRSERLGRTIGLGYIRRELLAPGTEVALPDGGNATVTAVPFE
jgi:folate-binding protein YgfZ